MKRFILSFGFAPLAFVVGVASFLLWNNPRSTELSLTLTTTTPSVRVGESPHVAVYITNHSDETATLVQPGDGSESRLRTPVVQWSMIEVGADNAAPGPQRGCGNIHALEWNEVFTLAPGETKELRIWSPGFEKPGSYKVKFSYANRPSLKWGGWEMGLHNPLAMWRVKHSTECELSSNELTFSVQ